MRVYILFILWSFLLFLVEWWSCPRTLHSNYIAFGKWAFAFLCDVCFTALKLTSVFTQHFMFGFDIFSFQFAAPIAMLYNVHATFSWKTKSSVDETPKQSGFDQYFSINNEQIQTVLVFHLLNKYTGWYSLRTTKLVPLWCFVFIICLAKLATLFHVFWFRNIDFSVFNFSISQVLLETAPWCFWCMCDIFEVSLIIQPE